MRYQIQNEKLIVEVLSLGAQLCSVRAKNGIEYLWQGDASSWEDQSPILFPYVGRMWEKKYSYKGTEYSMDIHGFAQQQEFACKKIRENYLICYIEDTQDTRKQYPFRFRFEVHYELNENKVRIHFVVKNKDDKNMYFGIGGHPGFRVPMHDGEKFEDYTLRFSPKTSPKRVGITNAGFLKGEPQDLILEKGQCLTLHHRLFDDDAIVLHDMGAEVQLWGKEGKVLSVHFSNMDYLGLWHMPKKEVSYVCIEPWSSLPSREGIVEKLEQKEDLIRLHGHEMYENIWEIEIADKSNPTMLS